MWGTFTNLNVDANNIINIEEYKLLTIREFRMMRRIMTLEKSKTDMTIGSIKKKNNSQGNIETTTEAEATLDKIQRIEDGLTRVTEAKRKSRENMIKLGFSKRELELKEKQEEYKNIENIINNIDRYDLIDFINNAEILYKSKEEINDILDYINVILFNKAKDEYLYTNCIQIVENTKKRLKQNANYDMSIDNMLFNIWEEIN